MKVRLNGTIRHERYGLLIGGKEYDLEKSDAAELAGKKLNHRENWATIVSLDENTEKIEAIVKEAAIEHIKKNKTKLKIKRKLVESNERTKEDKEKKLKRIDKEEKDFEKEVKKIKKEILKEESEEELEDTGESEDDESGDSA